MRNDEFPARQDFDVGQILDALLDKFDPVGKGEFAFVLLDDEDVKLQDSFRRVFDQIPMPQGERVAIHNNRAYRCSFRPKLLLVSLKLFVFKVRYVAALFILRRNAVTVEIRFGRRGVFKFFIDKEVVFRKVVEIFFRDDFVTQLVDVAGRTKNFAEVVRRVEGVEEVEERDGVVVCMHMPHAKENDVAGLGIYLIEIVEHVLRALGKSLPLVFDAVRQFFFVKHSLQITFNRLVVRRMSAEVVARSEEINRIAKMFGLVGGEASAVLNSLQRSFVRINQRRCSVEIFPGFFTFQKFDDLRVCVSESVKRRNDLVAGFVRLKVSQQHLRIDQRFAERNTAFVTPQSVREIGQNHSYLGVTLQEMEQRNIDVCPPPAKRFKLFKTNDFPFFKVVFFFGEENNRVGISKVFFIRNTSDRDGRTEYSFLQFDLVAFHGAVDKAEEGRNSLVVTKLSNDFLEEQHVLFFQHEERAIYPLVDAKLRQSISALKTVTQFGKKLFTHKQTSLITQCTSSP